VPKSVQVTAVLWIGSILLLVTSWHDEKKAERLPEKWNLRFQKGIVRVSLVAVALTAVALAVSLMLWAAS